MDSIHDPGLAVAIAFGACDSFDIVAKRGLA